jgi:hypothetical protein
VKSRFRAWTSPGSRARQDRGRHRREPWPWMSRTSRTPSRKSAPPPNRSIRRFVSSSPTRWSPERSTTTSDVVAGAASRGLRKSAAANARSARPSGTAVLVGARFSRVLETRASRAAAIGCCAVRGAVRPQLARVPPCRDQWPARVVSGIRASADRPRHDSSSRCVGFVKTARVRSMPVIA